MSAAPPTPPTPPPGAAAGGVDADLVDLDALGRWMDREGLPTGPLSDVTVLSGGTQNLLLRFRRGGRELVLRRGPRHLRRASNEVMRREARVLQALAGSDVPHPGFVAGPGEPEEGVAGDAVFYLMAPVAGFNPAAGLPPLHAGDAAIRHEMGLQMADAVARLGAVDHEAAGLTDFGKPHFLERQVARWMGELDSYGELAGYPGPDIPGLDRVAAWLDDNRPRDWRPGIMHGDYHLSNVMISPDGPEVAAIVDWEMCTIGDPLLDLGNLLGTWPIGPDPVAASPETAAPFGGIGGGIPDLPTPDELVARYAARSDRDTAAVPWYTAMACFKLGIVLEGTHARACAGKAPKLTGDLLHATTLGLFARAHTVIAKG
ncbi:MAG TPA: phosphotransferase family protein [Acidimicrobiales bacterium]|nr:phosphotransferase family protein [Acidimicrobiales bacterium]